jgi:GST-like protein
MLELYHWEPNTAFLKPLIVLNEKGIDFTSRYLDFSRFEQYDLANFNTYTEVEHNPDGEGPILYAGGLPMTEAFFSTLYLDEKYPDVALRPADAYGRWNVLKWARFLNEVPGPAVATLGCHKYLVPMLKSGDRAAIEAGLAKVPTKERKDAWLAALNNSYTDDLIADSRRKLSIAVKQVEDALGKGDWLLGSDYSLVDIDAYSLLAPAKGLAAELFAEAAKTNAWLDRVAARPAVKAALATSKTGKPFEAFVPGPEHSRWG